MVHRWRTIYSNCLWLLAAVCLNQQDLPAIYDLRKVWREGLEVATNCAGRGDLRHCRLVIVVAAYEARVNPDQSCEAVLETAEWQSLFCSIHNNKKKLPKMPPTLQQTVRWITQLGGFLGRRHDGQPGVKVLWRGLARLHDITQPWQLALAQT